MCIMKLIHPKIIIKGDFKMSYRLYTDIIVAAKILDSYKRACSFLKDEEKAKQDIYISADSCLTLQRSCKNMGIENIFTNSGDGPNPNRDWDKKDYITFFNRFPPYFTKTDETYYMVNLKNLIGPHNFDMNPIPIEIITSSLRDKLLVDGSYSDRILSTFGLKEI